MLKNQFLKIYLERKKLQIGHLGVQCGVTRDFCTMFHSSFMAEIHPYNVYKHV